MIGSTNAVEDVNIKSSINFVEYIESTGTQHIDTGVVWNTNISIEIELMITAGNSSTDMWRANIYGVDYAYNNAKQRWGLNYRGYNQYDELWFYLGGTVAFIEGSIRNKKYKLYQSNTEYQVNDNEKVSITPSSQLNCNYNIYLFRGNSRNSAIGMYSSRIYYAKIYDNNVLVRDFRPVLDENNVACLYDEVSKTYFYNLGTGTFNAGPVI